MKNIKIKTKTSNLRHIERGTLSCFSVAVVLAQVLITPTLVLAEFKKGAIRDNVPTISSTVTPDRKTVSLLFSNMTTEITARQKGPAIATREVSFRIPIDDTTKTLRFQQHIRGHALCEPGTSIQGLVRLGSVSKLFQFTDICREGKDFFESVDLTLAANSDLQGTIHILAERSDVSSISEAHLSIDSIDIMQLPTVSKQPDLK